MFLRKISQSKKPAKAGSKLSGLVFHLLLLASCVAYSSVMKMEAICSSEMLRSLQTTWYYNAEDCILHSHCQENLKFKTTFLFFIQ
jgi:hypothetical protein